MKTKKFLTGFLVGVVVWLVLTLIINYITANGEYLQLTYLTEFSNKIANNIVNSISSNNQAFADTLTWTDKVANVTNILIYGILGSIVWTMISKAKKGN